MNNSKNTVGRVRFICIACLALVATSLNAPGFSAPGRFFMKDVTGALTIEGKDGKKSIDLKYAYAQGWLRDGKLDRVEIDFTDAPAPEDYQERKLFLPVLAREGRLNALRIEIYSNKKVAEVQFFSQSCEDREDVSPPEMPTPPPPPPSSKRKPAAKSPPPVADLVDDEDESARISLNVFTEKEIEGSHSLGPISGYAGEDEFLWSYEIAFKVKVNIGNYTGQVKLLPEGGGEAGKAYLAFYNAVMSEDVSAAKTFLSSESRRFFEREGASKRVSRLKELIEPLKFIVPYSYIYTGNRTAQLYLQDVEHISFNRNVFPPGQMVHLPPIMLGKQTVMSPFPGRKSAARKAAEAEKAKQLPSIVAAARMILEGNSWRIDWLLLDDPDFAWGHDFYPNLLWHLDTYKTDEEKKRIEDLTGGEPLPAGGGEPGKSYLAFCRAEKAGDKKALIKYLAGAQYDVYSQPALRIKPGAFIWKESNALDYLNIEVVGGAIAGEEAVLNVRAVRQGYATTGKVRMILEQGQWKIEREKWETDYSKKVSVPRRR